VTSRVPPTPGAPAAPSFGDERSRDELLSENARLRSELLRRRSNRPMWPVVAGLAAHIALRPILDPWLNSSSDGKVDLAIVILAAPLAASVVTLLRALRPKRD
jgi:hypothetical protein